MFYLKKKAKKLEVSKHGLIKLLNDKILFSEFTEECKKGSCVENIVSKQYLYINLCLYNKKH